MPRLPSQHRHRSERMHFFACKATFVLALGWAIYFESRDQWPVAAMDIGVGALAIVAWLLGQRRHMRAGVFLLMVTIYAALVLSAAFLDVPTAGVGRGIHEFLLALGVGSMLTLRGEAAWLRVGFPLACFATYGFFVGVNPAWHTAYAVSEDVRVWGVWVDHVAALGMLYYVVRVIQSDSIDLHEAENELRDGLLRDQFELFFQPQVDAGGYVFGAEALIRWRHPARGLVLPNDFIALAERSGLMPPLGDWVLRAACRQLAQWQDDPVLSLLQLAVNVSASQFVDPQFAQRVLAIVQDAGVRPGSLKLELTESMLAHDIDDVMAKMRQIKAAGIGFSLDDFGTGFSSLAYLRELPFDQLKIDQAFVRNMFGSSKDIAIVSAVVSLGVTLGLQVIAEGVETEDHRRLLAEAGCDRYQGYLYSHPLEVAEFAALMRRGIPLTQVASLGPGTSQERLPFDVDSELSSA